jgi:hypothetical protein
MGKTKLISILGTIIAPNFGNTDRYGTTSAMFRRPLPTNTMDPVILKLGFSDGTNAARNRNPIRPAITKFSAVFVFMATSKSPAHLRAMKARTAANHPP